MPLLFGATRDLTPFARLAGIPHRMLISGRLAALYELPASGDIPAERDDLRDLAWATMNLATFRSASWPKRRADSASASRSTLTSDRWR